MGFCVALCFSVIMGRFDVENLILHLQEGQSQNSKVVKLVLDFIKGLLPTVLGLAFWHGTLVAELLSLACLLSYFLYKSVLKREGDSIPIILGSLWIMEPETIGFIASAWLSTIILLRNRRTGVLIFLISSIVVIMFFQGRWMIKINLIMITFFMLRNLINGHSPSQIGFNNM